jgi:DNA repair exonuclease SbcCD nuclease subunit
MSKILLFSDLHCHQHKKLIKSTERLNDCLVVLDWVFKTAKKNNIKHLVFLGDLFHDRQKIDVLTYHKTFEIFKNNLENSELKVYLLLGNHDLWYSQKWDISSVFPLSAFHNVSIIDKPSTIKIAGYPVSFLPYTHDPLKELSNITNDNEYKILCGHIAVDGAISNVMHNIHMDVVVEHDGDMIKLGADIFKDWDQVFLGHYHAQQKLSHNVEYIGSPLQLSFGEAFQHKHIIIYDLETHEKQYVKNTFSPQHFIVPMKDIEKYDLNNNFVVVLTENISESEVVDLRNNLVKNNKLGSLEIRSAEKSTNEEKDEMNEAKSIIYDRDKMLEVYLTETKKNNKLDNLDENKLLEIGKKICEGVVNG